MMTTKTKKKKLFKKMFNSKKLKCKKKTFFKLSKKNILMNTYKNFPIAKTTCDLPVATVDVKWQQLLSLI